METRRNELTPKLFEPAETQHGENERIAGPRMGFWRDAWNRLKKNRGALIGLAVVIFLVIMSVVGPLLSPFSAYEQDLTRRFTKPFTGAHWFGTDDFGRDLWTRLWEGTRISLYIAFLATFLDLVVGVTYGAVSGIVGGRTDNLMQRGVEILNGVPPLIVVILAMLVLPPGIITITIALVLVGWTNMSRIVRGRMLQLKEQEFTLASRSLGASRLRLVTKHLLPNSVGPILINLMFTIPYAIFYEAFLSFIGLGIQPPEASLGALISEGYKQLRFNPYLLWYPAAVFSLLMICFNLLADGLRDALDPKMRK